MKFSTRELVTMGIFGALWGAMEITLGSLFHTLNVPMTGVFLAAIGVFIALIGRLFVNRPGSTIFLGIIVSFLKMLSMGGVILWPMIGILMEALIADVILSVMKRPTRLVFSIAGTGSVMWVIVHPLFTQGLLAGRGILQVWGWVIEDGARLLKLPESSTFIVISGLILIHLIMGVTTGLLAWDIGRSIQGRLAGDVVLKSNSGT